MNIDCPESIDGSHRWYTHDVTGYTYCQDCEAEPLVWNSERGEWVTKAERDHDFSTQHYQSL